MRIALLLPILLGIGFAGPSAAFAQAQSIASATAAPPPCHFVLGFHTMSTLLDVGACTENQHSDGQGNQVQRTTNGLLVWRAADNWTAFTDGYKTWINGPKGLQQRLNSQCFSWESGCTPRPQLP